MRVIVEVRSGPLRGKKIPVRSGQKVQFGRTEWADAVFAQDDEMSGVHFSLEVADGQCLMRDLESTNGTRLNDHFVTEAALSAGDVVTAGHTQFAVQIEGGASVDTVVVGRSTVVRDKSRVKLDASLPRPSYRVESFASGLTLVTGGMFGEPDEPTAISDIVVPLSQRIPAYLLVDFKKCEQPLPEPSDPWTPLFDWLPPDVAALNSPLIAPAADIDVGELVNATWDQDAVIVLYSQQDTQSMVAHLQAATRLNLDGSAPAEGEAKGMLGYCWPSVLAPLLSFRTPEFVGELLRGMDAALIEIPDLPGMWQIYCANEFPNVLADMGFREVVDEEPGNDADS